MNHLIFQVEDRPPLLTTILLAAQHMLAALGGIIAVPLVVGALRHADALGEALSARGLDD